MLSLSLSKLNDLGGELENWMEEDNEYALLRYH